MTDCPPASLHVAVVPACIARKAPQWGLSFVERPPENVSGLPRHANSLDFLLALMVEWSLVMHDVETSGDALRRLPPVEIRIATTSSNPDRSNRHQRFECRPVGSGRRPFFWEKRTFDYSRSISACDPKRTSRLDATCLTQGGIHGRAEQQRSTLCLRWILVIQLEFEFAPSLLQRPSGGISIDIARFV